MIPSKTVKKANVFIKERVYGEKPTPRAVALLPVAVFLVLYLVLGIILEYVLKSKWASIRSPSSWPSWWRCW